MTDGGEALREVLLREAKEKLRVTWDEDDARISRLIESAQVDLNRLCGYQFDYSEESLAKTLMFEYVYYSWNNSFHEFRKLYRSELIDLIISVP